MKGIKKVVLQLLVVLVFAGPMVGIVASAHESVEDKLQLIHFVNSEVTLEEIEAGIAQNALEDGISFEQAVDEFYKEALEEYPNVVAAIRREVNRKQTSTAPGEARYRGDVFYSGASTLGVRHGHSGIYYTTKMIVHAPGPGRVSKVESCKNETVVEGKTQIQYVRVSVANSNKAADYAYKNLRNKPYDLVFYDNKKTTSKLNCSGLVWQAYKKSINIDLDSNGGKGVYPADIRDSRWTVTYKWV